MHSQRNRSRLFKSANKPPTPEDVASCQNPLVDLWNQREQRLGQAMCQIDFFCGTPQIVYQMIEGCGSGFTHWRWS